MESPPPLQVSSSSGSTSPPLPSSAVNYNCSNRFLPWNNGSSVACMLISNEITGNCSKNTSLAARKNKYINHATTLEEPAESHKAGRQPDADGQVGRPCKSLQVPRYHGRHFIRVNTEEIVNRTGKMLNNNNNGFRAHRLDTVFGAQPDVSQ